MLGCSARTFSADLECVKAVLRLWDPIGVFPDWCRPARDEYDSYAPRLLSSICSGAPAAALAADLEHIRTVSMGLRPHPEDALETAGRLVALRERPEHSFAIDGYFIAPSKLSPDTCDAVLSVLPATTGGRGGVRNLLANEVVQALVQSELVASIVRPLAGNDACGVSATLFDKVQGANWKVAWHQDRTGAPAARIDHPSFRHWHFRHGGNQAELPHKMLE